jgi:hypothetical protein
MQIANPIYDVVFKYLLEDSESAILLLSAIIGQPIEKLDFLPQEGTTYIEQHSLTVYRLDFCARIKTAKNEYKQVLIEIQKAKLPSDIMRFRRYLGEQYANKNNCYTASEQYKNGISKKTQTPLPIITIYFLGYPLKYHKVPVIKINRHYYDVVKQQRLSDKKEIFIESLTHDSYVIQISELDKQQQSELERLLSIFDQNRHITNNTHILELNENNYPQKYQRLIRRLQRAIAEPTIRKTMDVEDDYLDYLEDKERMIEYQEQIIEEKDQKLKEKNRKLKEKDQKLEKKNQLIAEQNRLIEQLKKQQ